MSPTPAGAVITATRPDGTVEDVTEAVQALYDLVIQQSDIGDAGGSGFVCEEEAVPLARLARVCGFKGVEEIDRYLVELEELKRRMAEPTPTWSERRKTTTDVVDPYFEWTAGAFDARSITHISARRRRSHPDEPVEQTFNPDQVLEALLTVELPGWVEQRDRLAVFDLFRRWLAEHWPDRYERLSKEDE